MTKTTSPDTKSFWAGAVLVVIGMQAFIIQPGIVALFVGDFGMSEATAGLLTTVEMIALAVASTIWALIPRLGTNRSAYVAGIAIAVIGNLLTAMTQSVEALFLARMLAGLGTGMLIALGYSVLGKARDPDRAFGFMIAMVLLYSAAALFALPFLVDAMGPGSVFVGLMAMTAAALLLLGNAIRALGASHVDGAATGARWRPDRAVVFAFLAIGLFFLGQGMIWAFLALVGMNAGLAETSVVASLSISQCAGIAGALLAATTTRYLGQRNLLVLGCLGCILPCLYLTGPLSWIGYGVAVFAFNGAANVMTPLVVAIAVRSGDNERIAQAAAALQMFGLALGPAIAGQMIFAGSYDGLLILVATLFCAALVVGWMATRRRFPITV